MIGMNGPPAFGVDVANLRPGETTTVNATSDGFPFGLDQLPAGDYSVQAVLIPYKKAKRSDGHTIWVPMNEQRVIDRKSTRLNSVTNAHLVDRLLFDTKKHSPNKHPATQL